MAGAGLLVSKAAVVVVYGVLAGLALVLSQALGIDPLATAAWVPLRFGWALAASVTAGAALGVATVAATRQLVRRAAWARALLRELRPALHKAGNGTLAVSAVASGVGEELFFRGLLLPLLGLVASALAFGVLHQVGGRARWAWMGWAVLMGLLFGCLYEGFGSLAGPVLAHVVVNLSNLRYVRDARLVDDPPPRLGGVFGGAGP